MGKLQIYHGSSKLIQRPEYGLGKEYNDYGRGFYCTESIELAKEWACAEERDGYANCYELDMQGLRLLDLTDGDNTILHWLALLVDNRTIQLKTPVMRQGVAWLQQHFLLDVGEYDVIKGYRADDSYFSFARAFVNNEISLDQLSRAMKLGQLGEQIVLVSARAFEQIRFKDAIVADYMIYFARRHERDAQARENYRIESDLDDIGGIYMRDIIREEMTADDSRLQ